MLFLIGSSTIGDCEVSLDTALSIALFAAAVVFFLLAVRKGGGG
jgi:hypothetical protein